MACPACAGTMRGELAKDTHAAFMRAILFGVGARFTGAAKVMPMTTRLPAIQTLGKFFGMSAEGDAPARLLTAP